MKTFKFIALSAVAITVVASCVSAPKVSPQPSSISKAEVDSASFAIGVYLGKMVINSDLGDLNMSQIVKGYCAAIQDPNDEKYDQQFINVNIGGFMEKRTAALSEENQAAGEKFLAENAKKDGVVTTPTGLQYKIIREGSDVKPVNDEDVVDVMYEGKTIDGKVFDTTYEDGNQVSFPLNRVIPGWTEGMKYIGEGGEIELYIPADLAYGENGPMGPQQTLIFKVELVSVTPSSIVPVE